jgi:hypothetical protein
MAPRNAQTVLATEAAGQFPLASNVYAFDCRGNNAPTMFGKTICYEKRPQPKPRAL